MYSRKNKFNLFAVLQNIKFRFSGNDFTNILLIQQVFYCFYICQMKKKCEEISMLELLRNWKVCMSNVKDEKMIKDMVWNTWDEYIWRLSRNHLISYLKRE